jgi:hypothetical protein
MQESLERKRSYLKEVLDLTNEQARLAKEKKFDEEAFGAAIDRKEILINNINEIDKGFTSVYDRVRSEVMENKDRYSASLKEMQTLITECVNLGMEIEALEERNRATLEQAFAVSFKNIRQVKQSKKVANKYYKAMATGGAGDTVFYDKKK